MISGKIVLENPKKEDAVSLKNIAVKTNSLDVNSTYSYALIGGHFFKTSIVAKQDDKAVGFISAYFLPSDPKALFVWQVAVDPDYHKRGIAGAMLRDIYLRNKNEIEKVQTTISPSNAGSNALFDSFAKRYGFKISQRVFLSEDQFEGDHEKEIMKILFFENSER